METAQGAIWARCRRDGNGLFLDLDARTGLFKRAPGTMDDTSVSLTNPNAKLNKIRPDLGNAPLSNAQVRHLAKL